MKKITQDINAHISFFLAVGLLFFASFMILGFSPLVKAQVPPTTVSASVSIYK